MPQVNRNVSTPLERWLLLLFVAIMPLQEDLPTIYGASVPVILLAILTGVLMIQGNGNKFSRALAMPLVLSFFIYVGVTTYVEFMHESPMYGGITRTFLNYCGAIVLGVAIKDEKAFRYTIIGYLISGLYLGIVLYIYGWGMLSADTSTFFEADAVRDDILTKLPIRENANTIASRSALCVLAIFLMLLTKIKLFKVSRRLLIMIAVIQALSLVVTMSRTGLVILLGTLFFLVYYYRLFSYRRLGYAIVVVAIFYVIAPQSYIERMQIETNRDEYGQTDSRTATFNRAMDEVKKNYLWGTGEGNLWIGDYSRVSGLSRYDEEKDRYFVGGTHNLYMQATLQWGILGLLTFLYIQYNVIKLLPRRREYSLTALIIAAFNVGVLILLFFVHDGNNKEFAVAYGLLIAYHLNLKEKTV